MSHSSAPATSGCAGVLAFVRAAIAGYVEADNDVPCVLLSYAQSADGSLAAFAGRPTAISCPDSLHLTHALRSEVDAILVGAPTVLSDNPSLTCRLGWPPGSGSAGRSPRAVVLDPDARLSHSSKLLADGRAARPIVITRRAQDAGPEHAERVDALLNAGAVLLRVPAREGHARAHLDLRAALVALRAREGIGSVMVEGGAGVIASVLEQRLGHVAAITIAPLLLPGGLHVVGSGAAVALTDTAWHVVGRDILLVGRLEAGHAMMENAAKT